MLMNFEHFEGASVGYQKVASEKMKWMKEKLR